MAAAVYALCAVTSTLCGFLLLSKFRRSGVRVLLWSGICFAGLAINNVLLFFDVIVLGNDIDLSIIRSVPSLLGLAIMIGGFIWEKI